MNVGAQLRQARESRGLTIAALAGTTRIQPKVLDALERNDLSAVPPQPYARGFVAAVARELGLNPDQTVREYFAQFEPEPAPLPPVPPPIRVDTDDRWRGWAPLGALALIILVGLFLAGRTEVPSAGEPGAVGTSGPTGPNGTTPPPTAAPAGAPARAAQDAPRPTDVNLSLESVVVVLEAVGPSWVTATVDGERQLFQIIPAGTKHTLRGTREVAIRVGDAGAVRWSVNGQPPVLMGRAGEVRDVRVTTN